MHTVIFTPPLAFFGSMGVGEMLLLGIVALLLYGGDLPEAARHWGKQLAEFRRHINGVRDEFNAAIHAEPARPPRISHLPAIDVTPVATVVQGSEPTSPAMDPPDLGDATPSTTP
jgi:Sec-independent protein translocase protein TatA